MGADQHYDTELFAQAMCTANCISIPQVTQLTPPPPSIDPASTTIKREDLAGFTTPSRTPTSHPAHPAHPTPSSSDSRQVKKRKSWGQVLPEPKTNLPPRKRAKTEDEKEQRRIERVKRNRLAAHNSRERKRQEVELLQTEKDKVEDELRATQYAMARMAAQLHAIRERHPEVQIDFTGCDVVSTYDTPSPQSHYTRDSSETVCPRQTSFPSPVSMDSMDTPRDDQSCQPETPAYSEDLVTELDPTRYPAAILCDLLCQSSSRPISPPSLHATLAFLILFNLTLPSMRSPWTTSSALTSFLNNMATSLSTWWIQQTSSTHPSTTKVHPQLPTAYKTHMKTRSSNCRQPLAQLTLATGLSQRATDFKWIARPSGTRGRACRVQMERRRSLPSGRFRRAGRRAGFSLRNRT